MIRLPARATPVRTALFSREHLAWSGKRVAFRLFLYNTPPSGNMLDSGDMTKLRILEFPDRRLHRPGKPVDVVDDSIRTIVDDMFETMYAAEGCGLAAPQVDIEKRIFVMDVSGDQSDPLVFINPVITPLTDEMSDIAEGCLSVPGFLEKMHRPRRVSVEAMDASGRRFVLEFEDLAAICVQHEYDHLEGRLFVDQLTRLKQQRIKKKIEKNRRSQAG